MKLRYGLLAVLSLAFCYPALAQFTPPEINNTAGALPNQPYHGTDIETVNLANGSLNIDIPILSYPQRGKLKLGFEVISSGNSLYLDTTTIPGGTKVTVLLGSPHGGGGAAVRMTPNPSFSQSSITYQWGVGQDTAYVYTMYDADGAGHVLGNIGTSQLIGSPNGTWSYSGPFRTLDASGWLAVINSSGETFTSPEGVNFSETTQQDANGNQITYNYNTNIVTDSLDRSVVLPNSLAYDNPVSSNCSIPGLPAATASRTWTVPAYGGTATYWLCYTSVSAKVLCGAVWKTFTFSPLQSIVLPNHTAYSFEYNDTDSNGNVYGNITKIHLPEGGTISYAYELGLMNPPYARMGRRVKTRAIDANDGSGPQTWTYTYGNTNQVAENYGTTTVTDPLGNYIVHTFQSWGAYETESQAYDSTGHLLKTVATTYYSTGGGLNTTDPVNVVPLTVTTTLDNGQTSEVVYTYDSGYTYTNPSGSGPLTGLYGQKLTAADYDFGHNQVGSLIRTSHTTYESSQNSSYGSANLLHLPATIWTTDGSGIQVSSTSYSYDQSGYSLQSSGAPNLVSVSGPRGNLNIFTPWLNGGSNPVSKVYYYDSGMPYKYYDPNAVSNGTNPSVYGYDSTGAFLNSVTDPLLHQKTATYDIASGVMTLMTDENGRRTTFSYDAISRNTDVVYPLEAATGISGETQISYQETSYPFTATVTSRIDSSQWKTTITTYDGLGRVTKTQDSSDPQGAVIVVKTYDGLGRLSTVTNPYRSGDSVYTTTDYYDGLSRKVMEVPTDGSTTQDNVQWSYSGSTTTTTDEANRTHQTTTNALGWLTQVVENSSQMTVNGVSYPALTTNYAYDALGKMFCAYQIGTATGGIACPATPSGTSPYNPTSNPYRARWFVYDSLSRLTDAYNPETGHTHWTYDGNGNVLTKTDAKSQTIAYAYDVENRVTGKTYSAGDQPVTYVYDQSSYNGVNVAYPIHKHMGMSDASGLTAWSFDERGRIVKETQTIGSYTKSTTTVFNVAGLPTSITYPNGTVLTYGYDSEGRAANVADSAHGINYVTGPQPACGALINGLSPVCYTAAGMQSGTLLGYDSSHPTYGITVTEQFNNRLQPAIISASASSGTLLSYSYSENDGTGDNGNVVGIVNNLDSTRTKAIRYDAFNRISEYLTSHSSLWDVKYTIDAWGNLTAKTPQSGYGGETLSTSGANYANQLMGFGYDANGNLTTGDGHTHSYDSENRISSLSGVATYTYDGGGNRVQKSTGETYWGGGAGSALVEADNSGNFTEEYIFFNGKRVARRDLGTGAVHYYVNDHLGSATIVTDSQGNVSEQYDYAPYGELHWSSGSDPNHYLFTGKERDTESGHDYFGARYFESSLGRFITPDWSATPSPVPYAHLDIPQTLNLYAYVANNPVSGIDPDGHKLCGSEGCEAEHVDKNGAGEGWAGGEAHGSLESAPWNQKPSQPQVQPSTQAGAKKQNDLDPNNKKSKIPAHAVIVHHEKAKNGNSRVIYTYQLENAAGKKLKGAGYAVEEHIKRIVTVGNIQIPLNTSEGSFVPAINGQMKDSVGLAAPIPKGTYYFDFLSQTFTVSYGGNTYELSTEFFHVTQATGGSAPKATVGVIVP